MNPLAWKARPKDRLVPRRYPLQFPSELHSERHDFSMRMLRRRRPWRQSRRPERSNSPAAQEPNHPERRHLRGKSLLLRQELRSQT